MGRGARMRPARLPEKILKIREALGETQEGMVRRLGFKEITREYISGFERGTREPPLPVLLRIANLAGVYVEVLIDDEVELPEALPAKPKSVGVQRRSLTKGKAKS
jgi:transcriptional regulator with XRE-family HTH domain